MPKGRKMYMLLTTVQNKRYGTPIDIHTIYVAYIQQKSGYNSNMRVRDSAFWMHTGYG